MAPSTTPGIELHLDGDGSWQIACINCTAPLARGEYDGAIVEIDDAVRLAAAHRCDAPRPSRPTVGAPAMRLPG